MSATTYGVYGPELVMCKARTFFAKVHGVKYLYIL